jgi:hypothetical protein
MKHRTIGGVALGAAVFTLAGSVSAADAKMYHGSICTGRYDEVGYGPVWEGIYATTVNHCEGGQEHPRVYCPITRDLTNSATGLDQVSVEFDNNDYGCHEPTRIWGYLYSMNDDADAMLYVDYEYRSSTTLNVGQLHFDNLTSTLTTHNDNEGSYVILLYPGETDTLQQIMVVEANGTN